MRPARRRALVVWALPLAAAWPTAGGTGGPERAPTFVHDVLPLLQRQGCASAYCHGAATGQGGFKLSLFGGEPEADYAAIVRALGGRRLDLHQPDASLLLLKPMRKVEHGGGKRITAGSFAHQRLAAWIAAGAPFAAPPERRLASLTVRLAGERLAVDAMFATGAEHHPADVTALAAFASSDEAVAAVDRDGRVTFVGPGEAFLFARYAGVSARVAVLRPFAADARATAVAGHSFDATFAARLDALGLVPAPPAAPERIARRLWLDLLERPPTPAELQRFLALPASERVARTADQLLASPAFADTATRQLLAMLEVPDADAGPPPGRAASRSLRARLRAAMAADEPLPELTAELLADDSKFLARHEDPRDRAELVGRALLGVRIGCARCHDHPLDRWKQSDYLAFAACFAARPAGASGMGSSGLYDPRSGAAVAPRLLPLSGAAGARSLHAFVHDRTHDLFARALANRVFAWLLGAGLVAPLDDHRDTNPARHETWLAALQATFHAHGDRLRPLVRELVTSRLYQLEAGDAGAGEGELRVRFFAQRAPKPLGASVLRSAIVACLGVDAATMPPLPDSPLASRLALLNGEGLARALAAPDNAVAALVGIDGGAPAQLDALFSSCLTRLPTPAERAAFLPELARGADALRELAGALLLSREFEFVR